MYKITLLAHPITKNDFFSKNNDFFLAKFLDKSFLAKFTALEEINTFTSY